MSLREMSTKGRYKQALAYAIGLSPEMFFQEVGRQREDLEKGVEKILLEDPDYANSLEEIMREAGEDRHDSMRAALKTQLYEDTYTNLAASLLPSLSIQVEPLCERHFFHSPVVSMFAIAPHELPSTRSTDRTLTIGLRTGEETAENFPHYDFQSRMLLGAGFYDQSSLKQGTLDLFLPDSDKTPDEQTLDLGFKIYPHKMNACLLNQFLDGEVIVGDVAVADQEEVKLYLARKVLPINVMGNLDIREYF